MAGGDEAIAGYFVRQHLEGGQTRMRPIGRSPLKRRAANCRLRRQLTEATLCWKPVAATFGPPVPSFSAWDMNKPSMRGPCLAKCLFLSAPLVLPVSMTNAAPDEPLCILATSEMPSAWERWGVVPKSISESPWSNAEKADVAYALRKGLDELETYYAQHPSAISQLGDDAAASFFEIGYGQKQLPEIKAIAQRRGERVLNQLIEPFLRKQSTVMACSDYARLLPLALYAGRYFSPSDVRTVQIINRTNAAFRECGSLSRAVGFDYQQSFKTNHLTTEDVFNLVIWAIWFSEVPLMPSLDLPDEARHLPERLWAFLQTYQLLNANQYKNSAKSRQFYDNAYLATHIAYIPTGIHRYPIYRQDFPGLYRFFRENFYAVLNFGELDLVAEFINSLKQYGCTEENDVQVRDGTRYLLNLYHTAGDSWLAHRETRLSAAAIDPNSDDYYEMMHKVWTGMLGIRPRTPNPVEPDTYAAIIRSWLKTPQ